VPMVLGHYAEGVRIALDSLRANKLRTFLTLLGNIVGTMSVIAVVSLLDGIDIYAREKVLEEGSGVFTVQRVNFLQFVTDVDAFIESFYNPRLTLADVDYLRDRIPSSQAVGARVDTNGKIQYRDKWVDNVDIQGRSAEYSVIDDLEVTAGRHLAQLDEMRSRLAVIIGYDVSAALFGKDIDPIGKQIKVADRHFYVTGVIERQGTVLGNSRDRFVVIPVTTWLKLFHPRESITIQVKAKDITLMQDAMDETTVALRIRHHRRPSERNDFNIVTSEILLSLWEKIDRYLRYVLIAAVSISLVVGGIVLMNVMLVAVTDRTREIGIRKAIGATRANVLWQFMFEAVTLSLTGGLMGILVGFSIAVLVGALTPLPYSIQPMAIILGVTFTIVIGVIFGTYPANKASRLDPVEALRHE
jgi:putative ABC transport system permease protein